MRPPARSLFAPEVWAGVEAALRRREGPILVALDLDGTIAPIVRRPERVGVPTETLQLLRRVATMRGIVLAVVSARSRRDLKRLLPVVRIRHAAQYGLEGAVAPPAHRRRRYRAGAARIAAMLEPVASRVPGAWLELKGMTVALHDRRVPARRLLELRRALRQVAAPARRHGFAVVRGRRVTEFVPRGHDKGRAIAALRRRISPTAVFYFGDSEADEPAFAALGRGDFSVHVGRGATGARNRVGGPRGVARFFRALVSIRTRSSRTRTP